MVVRAPRYDRTATQPSTQVSVVSGDDLRATGERSLPRMIGAATGVWIQETNLGGGSPFIRGLTGNQILIVIDGVRINDSTTRFGPNQNLNGIDPSIVDRVEVIRGPAAVLYGSDAIGGVVAIWTRSRMPNAEGDDGRIRAEQRIEAQSQTRGYRGSMNVSGVEGDLGWFVSGAYQQWDDLRAGDGETQDFTGYSGGELFGSADLALGRGRHLRWATRWHRDEDVPRTDRLIEGFPDADGTPNPPVALLWQFALQEYTRHQVTYSDTDLGGFADEMQLRLSYRRALEVRERIDVSNTDRFRVETDEVETVAVGGDWKRAVGASQLFTWGFDAAVDEVGSARTNQTISTGALAEADGRFPGDSQYRRLGLFVQDEIFALDPVDVTLGLRYSAYDFDFDPRLDAPAGLPISDGADGSFDQLTASLQAATDLSETVRLSGTLAQGFRAPNLADLSQINSFGSGLEVGNPDLDPEQSLYGELAIDYREDGVQFGLAGYYNDISDAIARQFDQAATDAFQAADPVNNTEDVFLLVNRDKVVVFGLEAQTRLRVGDANSPWTIDGTLALQRGTQYSDDPAVNGTPYRRIPPLNGQLGVTWAPLERQGTNLERVRFSTRFAGDQDRLSPGDISDPRIDPDGTDSWAVLAIEVGGTLGVWDGRWSLFLDNLLDTNYRVHGSGFDAPGFGATLALQWSF
jgi:outer membrane receptor protein involved in Fe transport